MERLRDLIDTYKDYPKKGIEFKDVLGIIQEPKVFKEIIFKMSSSQIIKNAEAIISIDARGFIFGSAISLQASKPMIVARKPGKLPGKLLERNYNLEYGKNSLSIQKKALKRYNSFAIVDDLLATGGTVDCVSKIIESNNKEVVGLLVVVELLKLEGRLKLNFPVESSIIFWKNIFLNTLLKEIELLQFIYVMYFFTNLLGFVLIKKKYWIIKLKNRLSFYPSTINLDLVIR